VHASDGQTDGQTERPQQQHALTVRCVLNKTARKEMIAKHISVDAIANKYLSYRREIALQGGLVITKSGRLTGRQYFTDIIVTVT